MYILLDLASLTLYSPPAAPSSRCAQPRAAQLVLPVALALHVLLDRQGHHGRRVAETEAAEVHHGVTVSQSLQLEPQLRSVTTGASERYSTYLRSLRPRKSVWPYAKVPT